MKFSQKNLRIHDFEFFFFLSQPYQGWVEILMITLVYSKRVSVRNNLLHSVHRAILL